MLMSLASTANGVELIGSETYELGEIPFINPHCLMPYRNALRRAIGGAIKPKLYRAHGCLSVIPDNTGVRMIF